MEDRIEHRVTIRAAHDKVWQLVARPGWWLPGSGAEPARAPGRAAVAYSGDPRPYVIDTVRVEPQGYVSYRWASAFSGAEPVPGNATLVECYLRPVGDEVSVTVVESGFMSLDLPDTVREDQWKGNRGGWQYELSGLRTRAEAAAPGAASLPPGTVFETPADVGHWTRDTDNPRGRRSRRRMAVTSRGSHPARPAHQPGQAASP